MIIWLASRCTGLARKNYWRFVDLTTHRSFPLRAGDDPLYIEYSKVSPRRGVEDGTM
jgi:hypothetical protein